MNEDFDYMDVPNLRQKAEEKLKGSDNKIDNPDYEGDIKKMMHELQVHQIELEMQNEELRKAYEITEEALKKYTMLYDFAPIGLFIIDSEGGIADLNFTGAEILGQKRFSLINTNIKLFVSDESRIDFNAFLKNIFTNPAKDSCQVMFGFNNNPGCRVYMEGVVVGTDQNCLLSMVDISRIK